MKRFLFLTLCCCIWAFGAEAAPALRIPFTVKQADGTLLTIEQFGDEWFHWTATTDGTLVVPTDRGYYIAQIDEQGNLSATDILAHEPALRNSQEQTAVSRQAARRDLYHKQVRKAALSRRAATIEDGNYLQHTGSPRVLTILANFSDKQFTGDDPLRAFDQYLNGEVQEDLGNHNQMNVASVRQYFETSSNCLFLPQFDVIGPVTLPQTMAYYGGSNNNGSDDRFGDFCKDAIDQAKKWVSDWSVYDNDKDGNIELVCVIFAGYGQNQGGASNTIWAKAAYRNMILNDELHISRFNCCSELFHPQRPDYINGTGVFIHEFSHCMGLPDLYPTTVKAYVNNQGMEAWSIMDYGLYANNGFAPIAYNAWEQEVMGWTKIEDVSTLMEDGTCQIDEILPLIEGGKAYKLVNGDNERDYIVMENIQKRGLNKHAYGQGLLIYHVDYPYESINMTDSPNNNPGHPAVSVVPADGLLINNYLCGDGKPYTKNEWKGNMAACPFPGTTETTMLTDQMSLPNYCFYNGDTQKSVGFMLSNIIEDAESGNISFLISSDETTGITDVRKKENDDDCQYYDLQGRKVQGCLTTGFYIARGKKIIVK